VSGILALVNRPERAGLLGICSLAFACGGGAAPYTPHPQKPLLRVLGEGNPAPKAAGRAAPVLDREFVRRLALTKSFTYGLPVQSTPTPDGKSVLFLRSGPRDKRQALFELDVATGAVREVLRADALVKSETLSAAEAARRERMRITASGLASFELSKDGARVLVTMSGKLFVFTRATGAVKELPASDVIDPHFSPDGTRVAYVKGADVYAVAVDGGRETAVTRGGSEARTHGVAEFVAQEELDRSRGFWFSPDGARILYEEADASKVETLYIADPTKPERPPLKTAYPRAGRANAEVRFGLVGLQGGATTWIDWDHARFPYVATARWEAPDGGTASFLTLYVMDRLQENAQLLLVDPKTGKTRALVTEHDDAWLDHDPSLPRFMPDGRFLWSSDRGGPNVLELRAPSGEAVRVVASGYRELYDLDPVAGVATLAKEDDPTRARIAHVPVADAGNGREESAGEGVLTARFGRGQHDVYVVRELQRTRMPRTYVRNKAGTIKVDVPSVAEDPGAVPQPEIVSVGPDEVKVAVLRPRGFDPSRRYPVIDAAYGGPGHTTVIAAAQSYLRDQWLADATGAIVVALDARGTPHRGHDWERALDGKIGQVPLDGHVKTIEALGKRFPEMDTAHVGIYGWSFGGYLSALAVLERPDVYRVAVAGAPVVDWRDYDTAYTERYLGLPDRSTAAYDEASLLTHAAPKPGAPVRPLLLIHGTADDNVYFTHSLKLADAMERASRPFELMPLVGITHLPYDPDMAEKLWTRVAEFLRAHLGD
jgi:dipeptidyl-peptidase 4